MDDVDHAAERVERFNGLAVRLVLDRLTGPRSNGICKSCYDRIEPLRLIVLPQTRLCGDCAQHEEISSRRAVLHGKAGATT